MVSTDKSIIRKYVLGAYGVFFVLLLLTGIQMMCFSNELIFWILKNVCSWAPTFAVLILFKDMFPNTSKREQWKKWFSGKVAWKEIVIICGMQIFLFAVTIIAVSMYKKVAINELLDFSVTTMLMAFVNSAVSGATGEEAGWRGFLQPQCVQKKGLVKGSVIVGIIWGFWHAPLWFISCEYVGIDLLKYILFFMIMIVSAAVIIGIVYEKNQNLLVPILIHFFVNFTIAFVKDYILDISMFLAAVYFVCALVMVMRVKR